MIEDNELPPGFAGGILMIIGAWAAGIIFYGIIGAFQ